MTVGSPSIFAIESTITRAYEQLSLRALGHFLIHIRGHSYGVYSPNATMLACSLDEVKDRIRRRGKHTAPFADEPSAGEVADAIRDAVFAPNQEHKQFFGMPHAIFQGIVFSNHLIWAPDGDEAFDDGSFILHFDVGNQVRLVAFKCCMDSYHHDPTTLSTIWLPAGEFYETLENWRHAFEAEWATAPKVVESVM